MIDIKRFFFLSLVVHGLVFAGLSLLPPSTRKPEKKEFMARLVSPEEMPAPRIIPPPKEKVKPVPVPVPPPRVKKAPPPPPAPPRREAVAPPSPPLPGRARPTPDETPVVPGLGRESGKPLPEGVLPKAGGEGEGEKPSEGRGSASPRDLTKPGLSAREKLFDRDVIGKAGREGTVTAKRQDAITFDTSEYRYAGYMRRLKEKIEGIWVYPAEARARGLYGDLKIRFTILKNGRLGEIQLVRTSGYRMLDDAAIKALKDGEPYWPLPDEWGMDSYQILGHFVYTIYGYGLR